VAVKRVSWGGVRERVVKRTPVFYFGLLCKGSFVLIFIFLIDWMVVL
jgi:hypothetical protein